MGHIDWLPIEEMPERLKNQISASNSLIALWNGECLLTGTWYETDGRWRADQYMEHCDEIEPAPTHFAEINAPAEVVLAVSGVQGFEG